MPRDVIVVPHTHWDREWYQPYQTFRMKLVDLIDGLLPLIESDPGYEHFQLDGQMAVVDDYLDIRPGERDRIRRLATSGRLSMGPWYILMDEFLVSGETIVRDLRLGLEKAAEFGGAMRTGYLPDMFGHVAQMPQVLALFGIHDAVVWRGVPSSVDRNAFTWIAPDGSGVRAVYLLDGYGNGSSLPDDAKELVAMIDRYIEAYRSFIPDGAPILWMNGTDHLFPQRWLGRVVAEANAVQDAYRLKVGSLDSYVQLAAVFDDAGASSTHATKLSPWHGELRSGARANLLMGVASNRVDVKRAAAAVERRIEKLAEPLCALYLPAELWPQSYLDTAWKLVIQNSAHDSICACSVDEVCDAVLHRFSEARHIGEGLTVKAAAALAGSLASSGTAAINPTARARGGLVEVRVASGKDIPGTQVLRRGGGEHTTEGITRADVPTLVQAALDNMPDVYHATAEVGDDGILDVRLYWDPARRDERYSGPVADEVRVAAEADPEARARMSVITPTSQKVLAYVDDVPGFGWRIWNTANATDLPATVAPVVVDEGEAIGVDAVHVGNGLTEIDIDPSTGTFALDGITGMGRLADGGDAGDTYNFNPPFDDLVVDLPDSVSIRVIERGPLRARVAIDRTYTWPTHISSQSRAGATAVDVTTTIEVQAGSPLVWVTTEFDNTCRDHRLRALFPLPEPATSSHAECAFAVVERPLQSEGGPTERAMATHPCRRFVCAGGITLIHDGLLEYELVEIGDGSVPGSDAPAAHALALTLLRCTGLISQGPMAYRPLPAGPVMATPGAQMQGPQVLRYALLAGDSPEAAYAAADEAFTPFVIWTAQGTGDGPDSGSALSIEGAEVSAVIREAGQLVVRVFNPSNEPTTVRIEGRAGWLVDLRGRPIEPFETTFALGPWKIATAQLTEP